MASTYKSNPAGWRRVMKSQGVQDATDTAAEQLAARARAIAPVLTGTYRDSIEVVEEPGPDGARSVVVAGAPYGVFVEARDNVLGKAMGGTGG